LDARVYSSQLIARLVGLAAQVAPGDAVRVEVCVQVVPPAVLLARIDAKRQALTPGAARR
jgi:hypothetical protein